MAKITITKGEVQVSLEDERLGMGDMSMISALIHFVAKLEEERIVSMREALVSRAFDSPPNVSRVG